MLIYHPAYDAYHCAFRTLLLLESCKVVEVDKLRILDFYLCFPSEVSGIRLARGGGEARRIARSLANPYHGPVNKRLVFRDMEHIQLASFRTIASSRLTDPGEYETGLMRRTDVELPDQLKAALQSAASEHSAVLNFIVETLADIPLYGNNGLKHRTELMEYRYDVA